MAAPTFQLTPAQQKALDHRRNIAVTASAGSGKTATLVERYLELLRAHPAIGPRNILAITFTQKAAAEMRQRLRQRLEQTQMQAAPSEQSQLAALVDELPAARISTIHAFCASVLREFPLEAGVDPAFAVLEQVEATILRREAVAESLEALARRPDGDPAKEALASLVREWGRPYLENLLISLLDKRRLTQKWLQHYGAHTPDSILAQWTKLIQQRQAPALNDLMTSDTLALLSELAALAPQKNAPKDTAEKKLALIRPAVAQLNGKADQHLSALAQLAQQLTTAQGQPLKGSLGNKANWLADDLLRLRQLVPLLGARFAPHRPALGLALTSIDRRAALRLIQLAPVFAVIDSRYDQKKGNGAQLDFEELQEKCRALLADSKNGIGTRLARQYRFVMVDEFQDTDPLQWALIKPLVCTDNKLDRDKLFIVGDPKQSIYGFRDADVAVFAQVKNEIAIANQAHQNHLEPFRTNEGHPLDSTEDERVGALSMAENFRTLPAPIALVNTLFPQFMQPVDGQPYQVDYEPLICRRANTPTNGSVELLLVEPNEDEEDIDSLFREAALMARRMRRLLDGDDLQIADQDQVRQPRPGDIAVLLRRRRYLPLYEQALRRLHIPFQVVGGLGFYQRQEVYDLANMLRALYNPADDLALAGALRSPYLGLSDEALFLAAQQPGTNLRERLGALPVENPQLDPTDQAALADALISLETWAGLKDRIPLIALLHRVLEDSGAWGFLQFGERGAQTVANIEKLLDLARAFEAPGFRPLGDFVAHLDLLIAQEEREGEATLGGTDAVQLLTIHASKGLEFPLVFVPDLDGRFNLSSGDSALIDPHWGIGLSVLDPASQYHRGPTLIRNLIAEENRQKAGAEAKRLFYVAATRARDHLFLSGRLDENHLKGGDLATAKDFLSWVCWGLELNRQDIANGQKELELAGSASTIPIHTDPTPLPTSAETAPEQRAWEALWPPQNNGSPNALVGELAYLNPLDATNPVPSYSTTQLMLFERDKAAHYRRYVLGFPETDLLALLDPVNGPTRQQALRLGELAHTALEELAASPDLTPERCSQLVLNSQLDLDPQTRQGLETDLRELLFDFKTSSFGQQLLAEPNPRIEYPFTLKFSGGQVDGIIDRIRKNDAGQVGLVDYKTSRITKGQVPEEALKYRRQMEIYALCLQAFFPGQTRYEATIFFPRVDGIYTFPFTPEDLAVARRQIERLLAQLADQAHNPQLHFQA